LGVSAAGILSGSLAAAAATFLSRVLMARTLEVEDLGAVLLAIAVASCTGGIASLGSRLGAAQRIAALLARGRRHAAAETAATALTVAAGAGAVAAAALASAGWALGLRGGTVALLIPVAPAVAGIAIGMSAWGIAQGHRNTFGRAVYRDTAGGALRLAGVALAAVLFGTAAAVAVGWTAGVIAGESLFVLYCVRRGWFRRGGRGWDTDLVRTLPSYAGITTVNQLRTWLDMLVLGLLAPATAVALYGLAASIARTLRLLQRAAAHRFLPTATSASAVGNETVLANTYAHARRLTLALLWPAMAVCLLTPEPVITLPFGPEYAQAATILRILVLGFLAPAFLGYTDELLIAQGRPRAVLVLGQSAVAASVLLMLLLVPSLGAVGAAVAVSVALTLRTIAGFALLDGALRRALWTAEELRRMVRIIVPPLVVAPLAVLLRIPEVGVAAVTGFSAVPAAILELRARGAGMSAGPDRSAQHAVD